MKKIFSTLAKAAVVLVSIYSVNQTALANHHYVIINHDKNADTPVDVFIRQAMLYGMKEVQLSGIANEKSTDPKIKAYAKMIIDEHAKTNEELKLLAKTKKVNLPMDRLQGGQRPDGRVDSSPENMKDTTRNQNIPEAAGSVKTSLPGDAEGLSEKEILKAVDDLKQMNGAALDQAYVDMMIADHQRAIALFEEGAKSKDMATRKFASKHLSKLKAHVKQLSAWRKS